jgi:hypothetical protein
MATLFDCLHLLRRLKLVQKDSWKTNDIIVRTDKTVSKALEMYKI